MTNSYHSPSSIVRENARQGKLLVVLLFVLSSKPGVEKLGRILWFKLLPKTIFSEKESMETELDIRIA